MDEIVNEFNKSPDYLSGVFLYAKQNNIPIISNEAASFIQLLLKLKRPYNILEIGTAIGYSACLMSKYLINDGYIVSLEKSNEMSKLAEQNVNQLNLSKTIRLIHGDANETLPNIHEQFDFIFLDGPKGQYVKMLPECIRLLKPQGILLADNIFQNGRTFAERYKIPRRQRTIQTRLRLFVEQIFESSQLDSSIFNISDGITVSIKKEKIE